MAEVRAFLAVPLPDLLKQEIVRLQQRLASDLAGIRPIRPRALHLTLHFFGDVTHEELEKIKVSMLSVKRIQKAFTVTATGVGGFPNLRRPRVLWIGLEPAAPLMALHRNCQHALHQAGLATERRPFKPHLTFGRLRQRGPDLTTLTANFGQQTFGRLPVEQLILYQSRLHSSGAEHLPLLTVDLLREEP